MMKYSQTRAVHAGRDSFAELGVHAPPIDLSTTYPVRDLNEGSASFEALVSGQAQAANPIYARMFNPTVARLEQALAELEGTHDAVAFASGMAASAACLLAAKQYGSHVVAIRPLYGTNDHILDSELMGIATRWANVDTLAEVVNDETALVFIETPANPTLDLVDIEAIVAAAGDVPVLVDSTFATPVLQQPANLGAELVLHSATKFFGGHGDVMAGVVCCGEAWAKALRQIRAVTGGTLHPLGAYLLHQGLPTLKLRVEKAQKNAAELAQRLSEHTPVSKVFYPGLGTVKNAHLIGTQMHGAGTLISFDLMDGYEAAVRLMNKVRVMTPAVSLGSVDTLIQHPAGLTHHMVDEKTRAEFGITDGLIRLSVGIEEVDDLWADLVQALSTN